MIEVEKKFILSEEDSRRLIEGAEFLSEKTFTDIYYDTATYALTSKDNWLRSRDVRFELKVPLHANSERLVDQYDELEDEAEISKVLNINGTGNLGVKLAMNGFAPFCICKTTRKKYKKGNFIIDLDEVDFKEFQYQIGEIELMVNDKSEINGAIEKILTFARGLNLKIAPVRGKVIEYLKRVRPEHYNALVASGVVKDF